MELRPYQRAAIESVYRYLREEDGNPVVCIPPAGGKTPILATIASDAVTRWDGRVLIVTHVRELVEQAVDKLRRVCPELPVGVFSAGLKRRDTEQPVIAAGIQSIFRRACDLGRFDLIIIDECHLLAPDGESMYQRFLADARVINPHVRLIGLTATPFRLDSGLICGPDKLLNDICFEAGIRELIRDNYLCPLISKAGQQKADLSQLHVRRGEFIASEVDAAMDQDDLVRSACAEIVEATLDRQAVLIFASGVQHGQNICRVLDEVHGIECGFVCGDTPSVERAEQLARFRGEPDGLLEREPLKYLCNVGVLTTGFDAPITDAIAILRPTNSPGLLVQIVGRGLRLHPDKHDTLILDFGGNIERHGPIDQITANTITRSREDGDAPAKECPICHSVIAAGYSTCPDCGFEFPPPDRKKHEAQASLIGVLSDQHSDTTYEVLDVGYHVHTKRGADNDAPKTMRVEYRLGLTHHVSEWICIEHTGYARQKAVAWWEDRSPDPFPESTQRAVDIAEAGGLAWPTQITIREWPGRQWPEVIDVNLGPAPEPCEASADHQLFNEANDLEHLPF